MVYCATRGLWVGATDSSTADEVLLEPPQASMKTNGPEIANNSAIRETNVRFIVFLGDRIWEPGFDYQAG